MVLNRTNPAAESVAFSLDGTQYFSVNEAQVGTATWKALLNPQSGKCLDDTGYDGSGTQLQIWDCTGNANQQWKLP
jgi:hypothetical protein